MTFGEACDLLPSDAEWSSSFGHAGDGGCVVIYLTPSGSRWTISNGPYHATAPFDWQCTKREG